MFDPRRQLRWHQSVIGRQYYNHHLPNNSNNLTIRCSNSVTVWTIWTCHQLPTTITRWTTIYHLSIPSFHHHTWTTIIDLNHRHQHRLRHMWRCRRWYSQIHMVLDLQFFPLTWHDSGYVPHLIPVYGSCLSWILARIVPACRETVDFAFFFSFHCL